MKKYTITLLLILLLWVPTVFAAEAPVNINTATVEQLSASLNGIGLKKAKTIVKYRTNNGSFTNIRELLNIKGIGPKILLKNKALLRVNKSQ